ncbi:MAG: ATP-binding protein [Acidobacteria bacterium]|nr:MAG: ATP-binding protein [Acidobacteriota bacterium]REK05616.1 MAG: ATP-binding protein [Acidobacteriota bacterium]
MLLKTWSNDPEALSAILRDLVQRLIEESNFEGLHLFDDTVLAVTTTAGDPDVVEAACRLQRILLFETPASILVRGLIFPARVLIENDLLTGVDDALLRDLEVQPPQIPNRSVQLTGHAVRELESRWLTRATLEYAGPSGRSRSIWTLTEPSRTLSPWRNLEVLRRRTPTVMRDEGEELRTLLGQPASLVTGALGCGKSRMVADQLATTGHPIVWANCWSQRSGGPSIAKDLLAGLTGRTDVVPRVTEIAHRHRSQLASWWGSESIDDASALAAGVLATLEEIRGDVPLHLVVDDVHRAEPFDREFLGHLLEHPALGDRLKIHLIGRGGLPWFDRLEDLPQLRLGPLGEPQIRALWQQLSDGLSIPESLSEGILQAANGHPWALEEALLQLVRRRSLRQLYGNFFYSGTEELGYEPTPRLTRHVEAEAARLGETLGSLLLAAAGVPVPEPVLSEIAEDHGFDLGDLSSHLQRSGLVIEKPSAWGPALSFACPAYSIGLEQSVETELATRVRRQLAIRLQQGSGRETANWSRYELLAGSEEAVPVLIEAARAKGARRRSAELFDALRQEIQHHRERSGRADLELELLWTLLPLARRLGRLQNLEAEIDRGLELSRGDSRRTFAFQILKAEHAMVAGDLATSERLLVEALRDATGIDSGRQSLLISHLGKLLQRQDRFSEARRLYENLLDHLDDGNLGLTGACHFHLGNIAMQEMRLHEALIHHKEALDRRRRDGPPIAIGHSLSALGSLNLMLGNMERSAALFEESIDLFEAEGADQEVSFPLLGQARRSAMLGDRGRAVVLARRGLERREGKDDRFGIGFARLALAEYQLSQGLYDSSLSEARQAHFQLTLTGAMRYLGATERVLGRIHLAQRHFDLARNHFDAALKLHSQRGYSLDASLDRAFLIDLGIDRRSTEMVRQNCVALLEGDEIVEVPERQAIDLRLYRGLRWLAERGTELADPLVPLRRAYEELCRRTELLEPEQRNTYLMHVPDNRELMHAAAEHELATVGLVDGATGST